MSIRRTQATVEHLWRALEMRGIDPATAQRCDPEEGEVKFQYKGKAQNHSMPPKLQGHGCCSKVVLLLMGSICCVSLAIGLTALVNLPVVAQVNMAFQHQFSTGTARDTSIGSESPLRKKPLPAILRRFSVIKRARPPERGADQSTLDAAFPGWRKDKDGTNAAIGDLALALAAVVDQLEPRQNGGFEKDTNAIDL